MKALLSFVVLALTAAPCARAHAQSPVVPGEEVEPALKLEAAYTGEAWANVRGGLRREEAYLSNLELSADLNADAAFGLAGTTFHASVLHNNRSTFSDRAVGDLQTVSNIDTDGSLRLKEMWIAHASGALSFKVGLIDLNTEFDTIETGSSFINSSFGIGPEFSQAGENGPSIFPITGLGALARFAISDRLEVRAGVFEGTPGHSMDPRRMRLRLDDEGALLVGELGYELDGSGRLAVGSWRLTDNVERNGGGSKGSSGGYYVSIDKKLIDWPQHSLSLFARIGIADDSVYQIASYQGGGILLSGFIFGAEEEQLGFGIASARNSTSFRRAQGQLGSTPLNRETAFELTYRAQLTPFLSLQPDIQYIVNPGTDANIRDALAIGMRIVLTWPA